MTGLESHSGLCQGSGCAVACSPVIFITCWIATLEIHAKGSATLEIHAKGSPMEVMTELQLALCVEIRFAISEGWLP